MTHEIIGNIIKDAREKYKSFESPNYSFVSPLILDHLSLYKEFIESYSINEDTDFNCEVCTHYYIEKDGHSWEVCVSLVGRYAMVSRRIGNQSWVVVCDDLQIDTLDEKILQIVKKHHFHPLSESVLKTIIPGFRIYTYDTEDDEMRDWAYVYQVLFFFENYNLLCDYDPENV